MLVWKHSTSTPSSAPSSASSVSISGSVTVPYWPGSRLPSMSRFTPWSTSTFMPGSPGRTPGPHSGAIAAARVYQCPLLTRDQSPTQPPRAPAPESPLAEGPLAEHRPSARRWRHRCPGRVARREDGGHRRSRRLAQAIQQQRRGGGAQPHRVARDRGDRRPVERGQRHVVARDQRQVAPHVEAPIADDLERADEQLVAAGDDRGRRGGPSRSWRVARAPCSRENVPEGSSPPPLHRSWRSPRAWPPRAGGRAASRGFRRSSRYGDGRAARDPRPPRACRRRGR